MTGRVHTLLSVAVTIAVACIPADLSGSDQKPAQSLEQRLLEDLRVDPFDDEVHRELLMPADRSGDKAPLPNEKDKARKESEELKRKLLEELGAAGVSENENPLLDVAQRMRQAEGLIGQTKSGARTQDLQSEIISKLDELLQQAKKSCKQGASSCNSQSVTSRRPMNQPQPQKQAEAGRKPGTKPAADSNAKPGSSAPRRPDMEEMQDLVKSVWGELPPSQREQMLQLSIEEFLPKYELLIEAYFRRLASETTEADRP